MKYRPTAENAKPFWSGREPITKSLILESLRISAQGGSAFGGKDESLRMLKQLFKSVLVAVLTFEARLVLKKYRPRIVAITGTVGKTTTKDAIYSALAEFFYVRKSEKSFNSEIGVPLTIVGSPTAWGNPFLWLRTILTGFRLIVFPHRYPKWLVLEVGADRPGDIARIARWLCPEVAVITRFAEVPVHIEFFSSPEAVSEEKAALAEALPPGGVLVLGSDDAAVCALKETVRGRRRITFGTGSEAEVRGSHYSVSYAAEAGKPSRALGATFKANISGRSFPAFISGALGAHLMQPVLAAFAVCTALNLNLVRVAEAMRSFVPPPGRMRLLAGVHESLIIDDSYNSSPVALAEALETLRKLAPPAGGGRKFAVLGDMMELGKYTVAEHRKAGRRAAAICDVLITVGVRARDIALGAKQGGMRAESIFSFEESRMAGRALQRMLRTGDAVLVKGSQAPRLERVVKEIMAEPERAQEFLVRQETEWQRRG